MNPTNEVLEWTDTTFDRQVLESELPVLVDFWAPWCAPCRAMTPVIGELAEALAGRALVGKVETDTNPELVERFSISSIPTFLILRAGRPVDRFGGVTSKQDLLARLNAAGA